MRIEKQKNKQKEENLSEDQPIMDETTYEESTEAESIQDFIELKRLQNRILGKLIDKIGNSENPEKTKNK